MGKTPHPTEASFYTSMTIKDPLQGRSTEYLYDMQIHSPF